MSVGGAFSSNGGGANVTRATGTKVLGGLQGWAGLGWLSQFLAQGIA